MENEVHYKQCTVQRRSSWKVVWIPEEFAVIGSVLKLVDEDGWEVKSVSSVKITDSERRQLQEEPKHVVGNWSNVCDPQVSTAGLEIREFDAIRLA